MTDAESWEHVGRVTVADRIEQDADSIGETFAATAARIRRGESLDPEDVERMRREIELAEYLIDDVLEPVAWGDVPERAHCATEARR